MVSRLLFFPAQASFEGALRFLEAATRMRRGKGLNRGLAGILERPFRTMATVAWRVGESPDIAGYRVAFRRDVDHVVPSINAILSEIDRLSPRCVGKLNKRSRSPKRPYELFSKPVPG